MSWIEGSKCKKNLPNFSSYVKELTGDLDDLEARITLIQFLKSNIGFTFELISGTKLLPFQEIILQGLMQKENALVVAGRGAGKSYIIAVFCCLYPVFNPNSKVCLLSNTFRGSRRIFESMEKIIRGKDAYLLHSCYPNDASKRNDIVKWVLPNGAEVFALPLSTGSNLRGTRASCVFLDEGLLISKDLQETIIRPFLTAKQNFLEETQIREQEDKLIKAGLLTENQRISFPKNKFLVMSSASYDFEYLAEIYKNYITMATEETKVFDPASYFVMRMSYEALPKDSFLDLSTIEGAKASGGDTSDYFRKEYQAQFINASEGYFSVKKMYKCTLQNGHYPTIQVKGEKNAKYILTIDPSYSSSKSSDLFAMVISLLIPEERKIVQVASYAKAGCDIKDHYEFLAYALTYFNIVWISIDGSGTEFTDGFLESTIAKEKNISFDYITAKLDGDDYNKAMYDLKREYNHTCKRFVYPQAFSSDSIRRMNEYLQNGIHTEKIWFSSKISQDADAFKQAMGINLPFQTSDMHGKHIEMLDYLEAQDDLIDQTKAQISMIEVKTTSLGTQQFDLPIHLKKSTSIYRARKDLYTCILMSYYASRFYFDMIEHKEEEQSFFEPIML